MANTRYINTLRGTYCYSAILFYFTKNFPILTLVLETLWQAPHRWPPSRSYLFISVIIKTRAWIHLDTFNSTDEVTLHHLVFSIVIYVWEGFRRLVTYIYVYSLYISAYTKNWLVSWSNDKKSSSKADTISLNSKLSKIKMYAFME